MHRNLNNAIELIGNPRRFGSPEISICVDLMREFLRREVLWANILGIAERLPFADLAEVLSPGTSICVDNRGLIDSFSRCLVEKICLTHMLKWYQIKPSLISVHGSALPADPYSPILRLFNLGGFFSREHQIYVDVNGSGGIHAGMVQHGDLTTPFTFISEE